MVQFEQGEALANFQPVAGPANDGSNQIRLLFAILIRLVDDDGGVRRQVIGELAQGQFVIRLWLQGIEGKADNYDGKTGQREIQDRLTCAVSSVSFAGDVPCPKAPS